MLLQGLCFPSGRLRLIWADAGYSGEEFAQWVKQQHGVRVEIVSQSKSPKGKGRQSKGFVVAPRRWVIERTFAWWNKWRRLSKDYEHNPRSSQAWIYVVMMALMLNRLA